MKQLLIVCLLAVVVCSKAFPSAPSDLNLRPIVGVLTQPSPHSLTDFGEWYIAASYIKYVEAGGARAVPVFHNATKDQLKEVFSSINGLLLPGGGANIRGSQLYDAAKYLFELAIEANKNNDYFPIAGHCQGFEILTQIITDSFDILTSTDAENLNRALDFAPDARQSRWMSQCPETIFNILETQQVTFNNHQWGVTPQDFANSNLGSTCRIVSTNTDRNGKEFVSTFEMKDYPVFAMQFHAEKPLFEWNTREVIDHSSNAVDAMQYFARYLAAEARNSLHSYASESTEYDALIYNYPAMYTEDIVSDFEQCYLFGPPGNSTAPPE